MDGNIVTDSQITQSYNYNPGVRKQLTHFTSMKDCLKTHHDFPEIDFEHLRRGACPSKWQFYVFYKKFMLNRHRKTIAYTCKPGRPSVKCKYYKLTMK